MIYAQTIHGQAVPKEQEYLQGWQRARAELLNFKQRMHVQNKMTEQQLKRKVVEPLLTVADSFQAVVTHVPSDLNTNTWVQGVVHVARQFEQMLNEYDLVPIGRKGEVFDPQRHEAISQVEDSKGVSGTIAEVIHQGYQIDEMVVRPAKVKVFA